MANGALGLIPVRDRDDNGYVISNLQRRSDIMERIQDEFSTCQIFNAKIASLGEWI
jgi:hypothetical protein